jgi:hypothetical protein
MNFIERKLQLCLNKLQNWANVDFLKFSQFKDLYDKNKNYIKAVGLRIKKTSTGF